VRGNKSTHRMNEFVQCVHELFTATENELVVTYLSKCRKRASIAATLPVQENWAKNNRNSLRVYPIQNQASTNNLPQREQMRT